MPVVHFYSAALAHNPAAVDNGPAFEAERLVSHAYTSAEKVLAANYAPGDVVDFHRDYKRLGVAKETSAASHGSTTGRAR